LRDQGLNGTSSDPMTIVPPAVYAGNMPDLPLDLSGVLFVENANLNDNQRALLAQNGFVVIPGGFSQFSLAYRDTDLWISLLPDFALSGNTPNQPLGNPSFVTTDAMLHALHYIFDNLLTDLERQAFIGRMQNLVTLSFNAAAEQYAQAAGTPLEAPAR